MLDPQFECRAPYCVELVWDRWDVCRTCWDYRHVWLDGLPAVWARADALLVPGGKRESERVSGPHPQSREPLRMAPLTAMSDALVRLEMWADTLIRRGAAADPIPDRRSARDDVIFERSLAVLAGFDHQLEGTGLTGDYYMNLYEAFWRLHRLDRNMFAFNRLTFPCPFCGTTGLIERHAGEVTQCLVCANSWTQAAFITWLCKR